MMRLLLSATIVALSALPALADTTEGTILAFDRQSDVLVMTDKTVWRLNANTLIPADLAAGDVVRIEFTSFGDDGVARVDSLQKL
jgi:hypothetical protein